MMALPQHCRRLDLDPLDFADGCMSWTSSRPYGNYLRLAAAASGIPGVEPLGDLRLQPLWSDDEYASAEAGANHPGAVRSWSLGG